MKIRHLCDGVYQNEDGAVGPEVLEHEGRTLRRFMDSFYIRCETEHLTSVEVSALCRARANNPLMIGCTNTEVQDVFRALIGTRKPTHLLEIGAGLNPLLKESAPQMLYVKCDADPQSTSGQGVFSGAQPALPYPDDLFDMAVAVFVLHFHFYTEQIVELHRCLAPKGVFVANVYRRTLPSLARLAASFESCGFFVRRHLDPRELCHGHEYWAISKDLEVAVGAHSQLAELTIPADQSLGLDTPGLN